MKERNRAIDLLRCMGALAVMIAHADPPDWLFQLRNFGTPLLIVVSALSAAVVYRDRPLHPGPFLRRRLYKLTVPPWLFLSVFFGAVMAYAHLRHKPFPFTPHEVLTSYALNSGIGYVWIFKVYITIALLTPLMMRFKAHASEATYFGTLAALYLGYELLNVVVNARIHDSDVLYFIDDNLMVLAPYAVLFAYGLELERLTDRQVAAIAAAALLVFVLMAGTKFVQTGHLIATQQYKYPPTLYYLSYALFCVNALYLLSRRSWTARLPQGVIVWMSTHLLWIYLWHIMAIFVWDNTVGPTQERIGPAALKLVTILAFGVAMTWLQSRVANLLLPAHWERPRAFVHSLLG
ncbi:MAG TPA: acyltransferase [Albitalea sp.]|uniref:acyltransferase n=1 Tax=Piscinibacter sp. TaxID=1903157 RepID=UPI002ED66D01